MGPGSTGRRAERHGGTTGPRVRPGLRIAALLAVVALLPGCASNFGPSAVREERPNYNREIVRSHDEQMLLNLVRLRYRDTPLFVELTSVVTSYTFDRNLSLGARVIAGRAADEYTAGAGMFIGNRPTITYLPLQGEEFAIRMLSPLPIESIMLFSQTGWSVERLMLLCVQRINDLENAPSATGPTPAAAPDFRRFRDLATRLRRLSLADRFGMHWGMAEPAAEGAPQSFRLKFWLRAPADPADALSADVAAVREALGLGPDREEYAMTPFPYSHSPDEVGIRGRSLLCGISCPSRWSRRPIMRPQDWSRSPATPTASPSPGGRSWGTPCASALRRRSPTTRSRPSPIGAGGSTSPTTTSRRSRH